MVSLLITVRHRFHVDTTQFLTPIMVVQHSWAILFGDKAQSVNHF